MLTYSHVLCHPGCWSSGHRGRLVDRRDRREIVRANDRPKSQDTGDDGGPSRGSRTQWAGILSKAGASPVQMRDQLGHSSIVVTIDTYLKGDIEQQHEAAQKVGVALDPEAIRLLTTADLGTVVRKGLEEPKGVEPGPCGARTHHTLIKSQDRSFVRFRGLPGVNPLRIRSPFHRIRCYHFSPVSASPVMDRISQTLVHHNTTASAATARSATMVRFSQSCYPVS